MERSWNPISKTFLLPRPPFHPCNPGAFLSSRHNSKLAPGSLSLAQASTAVPRL